MIMRNSASLKDFRGMCATVNFTVNYFSRLGGFDIDYFKNI
jgi:hypothetical protein